MGSTLLQHDSLLKGDHSGAYVPVAQTPTSGTAQVIEAVTDATHNVKFQWTFDGAQTSTGNAQTFTDPVFFIGWNVKNSASKIDAAQWAWHFTLEYDFWTNIGYDGAWHHQPEAHLQFQAADGTIIRVFSANVNIALEQASFSIASSTFSLADEAGNQLINTAPNNPVYVGSSGNKKGLTVAGALDVGGQIASGAVNHVFQAPATYSASLVYTIGGVQKFSMQGWDASGGNAWKLHDIPNNADILDIRLGTIPLNREVRMSSVIMAGHADLITATVGSAGAAAALPATPQEYLYVKNPSGTLRKIPLYLP